MKRRVSNVLSAALLALLVCTGCQGDKLAVDEGVVVKAKLLQGGQPLKAPQSDVPGMDLIDPFQINLVPQGSEGHARGAYAGSYSPDGTVIFAGPGKGIPPGVYKLTVLGAAVMPDAEDTSTDPFKGRFTLERTPFEFTITVSDVGKEKDLGTIDLDNPPK